MAKLPQVSEAEALRRLRKLGMDHVRTKGGHAIVRNPTTNKSSTVPQHSTLAKGTLDAILKQLSIDRDDFINA